MDLAWTRFWLLAVLPDPDRPSPFLIRSVFTAWARARRLMLARIARDRERAWRTLPGAIVSFRGA